MGDLITSVSAAITLARRLKEISDNIQEAEFKNLLADLSLELADVKLKLAEVLDENAELKNRLRALDDAEGDQCPKCRKRGWRLDSSKPDPVFGDLGGMRKLFKCSVCGFSEEKLETD